MAVQAFVIGYFIPQIMAFCAVEYAFQIGMRLRQISGRNLRTQLASKQGEENDDMKTFIFQLKIGLNCVFGHIHRVTPSHPVNNTGCFISGVFSSYIQIVW